MQQIWSRAEVGKVIAREGATAAAPPRTTIVEQVDSHAY